MTLAAILAALPTVISTGEDVVALLKAIRAAAATRGLDEENALIDAAIADAEARLARESGQ